MIIIGPQIDSTYGLTLQEMIDTVAGQIRNSTISTEITGWLNEEIISIGSRFRFNELITADTLTTIIGQRNYLLPANFRYLITIYNPTIRKTMEPVGEQELSFINPYYRTQPGQVTNYILQGRSITFYRVPQSVITIPFTYQRRPMKLVGLSDVSDLPPEWMELVMKKAEIRGCAHEERNDQRVQATAEYAMLLKELKKTIYNRPDLFNGFTNYPGRSSRPWPILDPGHFPRRW